MKDTSIKIAEHYTSGASGTASINSLLQEGELEAHHIASSSANLISAVDDFTSFINKTKALDVVAKSAVGLSLAANLVQASIDVDEHGAITNATLLALGADIVNITMLTTRLVGVGNLPVVQVPLITVSTAATPFHFPKNSKYSVS